MADVFAQHDTMFREISAFAIVKDGALTGRVTFRHRARCTCFFHIFGASMSKGIADGGGYDKASAAAANAVLKHAGSLTGDGAANVKTLKAAFAAARDGTDWRRTVEDAGFTVFQVI